MRDPKKLNLTEGKLSKGIWALALPTMFGNLFQTAFNVADTIFVGRLGPAAIAGVSMSGIVMMIFMTLVMGVSIGTVAMVSRLTGAKDEEGTNNAAMQSLLMGGILALIFSTLGIIFAKDFFELLGAQPEVIEKGTRYIRVMFGGIITMLFMFMTGAILRGAGDARTPMIILAASAVLNIILDPLLIFGIGFFPRLGVSGAAYATVFSRGMGGLASLYILIKGYSLVHVSIRKLKLDFSMMWRIIRIAIPGSIAAGMRSVSSLILMRIIASYGTAVVAAFGVGMRIEMVIMMPGFGLAAAAATLVGQNLGANKPDRAEKSGWLATAYYILIVLVVDILLVIIAPQIIGIFSKNADVIRVGALYVRVMSVGYIFLASGIILSQALNGAGDTLSPTIISGVVLFLIQIPAALTIPKIGNLGVMGLWMSMSLSVMIYGIITASWFKVGKWKYKKV